VPTWELTNILKNCTKRNNLTYYAFSYVYDAGSTDSSTPFTEHLGQHGQIKPEGLATKLSKAMLSIVSESVVVDAKGKFPRETHTENLSDRV
jgi:hypothetical protein